MTFSVSQQQRYNLNNKHILVCFEINPRECKNLIHGVFNFLMHHCTYY